MVEKYFQEEIDLINRILGDESLNQKIQEVVESLVSAFNKGNKILIAGNGGSAADAQHFAAELVGRYKKEKKGYPAISLSTDTSFLTAWGNDYDFGDVFARQIEVLGKNGDVFIAISTSGNSKNIVEALKVARQTGLKTISLLGKDGGEANNLSDISIIVPSDNTPRIQEIHGTLIHIICEETENKLLN